MGDSSLDDLLMYMLKLLVVPASFLFGAVLMVIFSFMLYVMSFMLSCGLSRGRPLSALGSLDPDLFELVDPILEVF